MKIERISENQIKFLLTNKDLEEREIKISELAKGSEKAQAFFRDIMTEAMIDYGFDASDSPLMIEAMPVSVDSIMIIVSKVLKDGNVESNVSLVPKTLTERKFKQEDLKVADSKESASFSSYSGKGVSFKDEGDGLAIYSFKTLQDTINVSKRLLPIYEGESVLYKYKDRYYVVLQQGATFSDEFESIIYEYGQRHISNIISKSHLIEHADLIIKESAIFILADL